MPNQKEKWSVQSKTYLFVISSFHTYKIVLPYLKKGAKNPRLPFCPLQKGFPRIFFPARKQNIVSYVFVPILCKRISALYNLDRSYCIELIFLVKTQTLLGFIDFHLLCASYHGLFPLSKKLPCQSDTGARYSYFQYSTADLNSFMSNSPGTFWYRPSAIRSE